MTGTNLFPMVMPQGRDWNAASGWEYGGQELNREAARQHLLQQMMLDNQRTGLYNDRYQQMTPHELSIKDFEAEQARQKKAILPQLMQGEVGTAQTNAARGQFDTQTLPGRISLTNQNNQNAGMEAQVRQLQLATGSGSPMVADVEYQRFLENNPNMKRILPAHYDPSVMQRLQQTVRDSTEHQRSVSGWDHQAARDLQREQLQQAGALERARLAAEAQRYTADRATERATAQETPPKAMARLRTELSQNPNQPEKVMEYKMHIDDQWSKTVNANQSLAMLQFRVDNTKDPVQKEQYAKQLADFQWKWYASKGVYLDREFGGKVYKYTGPFGGDSTDQKNWKAY